VPCWKFAVAVEVIAKHSPIVPPECVIANSPLTEEKEHVGVKKWFNLDVKQMGAALVSMKNKGEINSITDINFKLIEKL